MSNALESIRYDDVDGADARKWGRVIPFRPRSDELTMMQSNLAESFSRYRMPSGQTLKRLLALLEREDRLLWAVQFVANQLPNAVTKVIDVGIELEEFQDESAPIIWVEGYTTAGGKEAALSHQDFVRSVIVGELYAREIFNVGSTMKFV